MLSRSIKTGLFETWREIMWMWIAIITDEFGATEHIGPFDNEETALDFAAKEAGEKEDWEVKRLFNPANPEYRAVA